MSELNVPNRTLAVMDNLEFLKSINNECIDLIAIDPPFAANETFRSRPNPPITDEELAEEKSLAERHGVQHNEGIGVTRVRDVWNWDDDTDTEWKMAAQYDHPNVHAVISAVEACATENEAAYIGFMAARLIHCHRILKPTGSIYVHCDDHANAYLRMLMDAIFGSHNFRNELTWRRAVSHNDARRFGRITDNILYYAKSESAYWNGSDLNAPKSDEELEAAYPLEDEHGRYRNENMTGAEASFGESGMPWHGYDVSALDRHWAIPLSGPYAEYIERNFIPNYRSIAGVHERLDALDKAGLIHHPTRGTWPGLKRYADSDQGNPPQSLILNPRGFTNFSVRNGEYTGYATQKPVALYEQFIRASSRPGDTVLDIFAGCATTAVAAERLDRHWIACDMAYRSWTMLKRRFYLEGFAIEGTTDATINALASTRKGRALQRPQQFASTRVIGPGEVPTRSDSDPSPVPDHVVAAAESQQIRSSTWSGRVPKDEAKRLLIERFGRTCWGCGFEPRRPNGTWDETLLEIDHIRARRSATGAHGNDELYNLALLHRTCNSIKRNTMTLEELRSYNAENLLLYVDSEDELVDLFTAQQFATEHLLSKAT